MVSSSPIIGIQKAEAQSDFPSLSKYTIRALDLRAAASASIIISSASSGQSLIIPVTLIHVAEPSANTQGQFSSAGSWEVTIRLPLKNVRRRGIPQIVLIPI